MVPTRTNMPLPVFGALHWKSRGVTPPHVFLLQNRGCETDAGNIWVLFSLICSKNILITNILHSRDVTHTNLHFSFIWKTWRFDHAGPNSHVATTEWAEWWHFFSLWWRMPLHDPHHFTRFPLTAHPPAFICDLLPLEGLDLRLVKVPGVRSWGWPPAYLWF